MAYTHVWNNSLPDGTESANTIAQIISALKLDISQRLADYLVIPDFTLDPLRPGGIKFTDASDSIISLGDNSGATRSLVIKDKVAANTYFQVGPFTGSVTAGANSFLINTALVADASTQFNSLLIAPSTPTTISGTAPTTIRSIFIIPNVNSFANNNTLEGISLFPQFNTSSGATNYTGLNVLGLLLGVNKFGSGTINNYFGLIINSGSGIATGSFGAYIKDSVAIAKSLLIADTLSGSLSAPTTPNAFGLIDMQSTTKTLILPRMTTTQKNAMTPVNGMLVYDSTLNKFQGYENSAWVSLI